MKPCNTRFKTFDNLIKLDPSETMYYRSLRSSLINLIQGFYHVQSGQVDLRSAERFRLHCLRKLGSPVVPFYPFSFWVPLLKPNSRKKGTRITKGLLGNLENYKRNSVPSRVFGFRVVINWALEYQTLILFFLMEPL